MVALAEKRFDIDLRDGKKAEWWVSNLGTAGTIEVKTERGKWIRTGNLFFECSCRGKYSGLNVTTAQWWVTVLADDTANKRYGAFIFVTRTLKARLFAMWRRGIIPIVAGGDDNEARGLLLPIRMVGELFK